MKILFITQSLGKGGAERLVLDMAHSLLNQNPSIQVKIVPLSTLNDYHALSEGLDIKVCNSKVVLSITGKSIIDIEAYERIVDEFQPDVIHSHTYIAELVSRENARRHIAYFTHVHNDFPEFDPFSISSLWNKQKLTRYYERQRIFRKYRHINNQFITISQSIDHHFRKQVASTWQSSIHLIPNGIDYQKFSFPERLIDQDATIELITIGRLFPVKNQRYLLFALKELLTLLPDHRFRLSILGDGPEKDDLLKLATDLNVSAHIELLGMVDNVEDHLAKSHFYLHSASSEPFGLVLAEAMAASLPVVCLNSGGPADIIDHERDGFLLPLNTAPENYAMVVAQLVKDSALYAQMAKAAHSKGEKFDIRYCVENNLDLYKEYIRSIKSK